MSYLYFVSMQTIKNDDLEEIKELGAGTYGAVFHGKWRGCDVAIKRIKASCFAGRPSERERLVCLISLLLLYFRIGTFGCLQSSWTVFDSSQSLSIF